MTYVPKILKFSVKLGIAVIFITDAIKWLSGRRKLDSINCFIPSSLFNGTKIFTWRNNLLVAELKFLAQATEYKHLQF